MQTSDTLGGFRKMEGVKLECVLFLFENEWGKMCVCECDYGCVVWYTSFISTMMCERINETPLETTDTHNSYIVHS